MKDRLFQVLQKISNLYAKYDDENIYDVGVEVNSMVTELLEVQNEQE